MTDPDTASRIVAHAAQLRQSLSEQIAAAGSLEQVTLLRSSTLSRSGELMVLRGRVGAVPPQDRRAAGNAVNEALADITAQITAREAELAVGESALPAPIDTSVPGLELPIGGMHPTMQMMYDLNDAFAALNFTQYAGPEISSEQYEFDFMNFPPDHPARESMDTFWLSGTEDKRGAERLCLRPHLTGSSVRYMREHGAPVRMIYPGRVYRNESTDARHERSFFQYEVLLVDEKVPLTAGKFLVDTILDTVFGHHVRTRMRTGFFPFVEPGFEIDMECQVCAGQGCRTCGGLGWIELMPGGCPHPNVLRAGGLDPRRWTGFYVNVGLDRLVMMRYGIDDVRMIHSADLRWLEQYV
jgi:phenylalanyl-tRNA synthetase alpha chain